MTASTDNLQAPRDRLQLQREIEMEGLTIADFVASLSPKARAELTDKKDSIAATWAGYRKWQHRAWRVERPDGQFDQGGRWYPSAAENADKYVQYIRSPSRAWPWTYYRAAFALDHCVFLCAGNMDTLKALRQRSRSVRMIDLMEREGATAAEQVVAALACPAATQEQKWWKVRDAARVQPVRRAM